MVSVRTWGQQPAHNLSNSTCVTRGVTCGAVVNPCSGGDHITPQDEYTCNLWWCKLLAISCVLASCYLWCPPSNLFDSNKVTISMWWTRYVRHSQDFPPRAQYMCEKHFHDAKSWPLCCISPAPVSSAIHSRGKFSTVLPGESNRYRTRQVVIILVWWI